MNDLKKSIKKIISEIDDGAPPIIKKRRLIDFINNLIIKQFSKLNCKVKPSIYNNDVKGDYIIQPTRFGHYNISFKSGFDLKNFPESIIVFTHIEKLYREPDGYFLKQKYPILNDYQIDLLKEKFDIIWNYYDIFKEKDNNLKKLLQFRFISSLKFLLNQIKINNKNIDQYVKKNFLSKTNQKKSFLLNTIKNDFESFIRTIGGGDIEIKDNYINFSIRHLGHWIHNEEDSYYRERDGDSGWREDDDQMIWAPGEYKKYYNLFLNWAKSKLWFKKVKLELYTSEKNWVEFSIKLK